MSLTSCLENVSFPPCVWFQDEEKRNALVSLIAGLLFFTGWWIIIDVNVTCFEKFKGVYHLCGIFATISLIMVNSVSNVVLRGEWHDGGCMGQQGARLWLFLGFLTGFAAIIAACWILIADFQEKNPMPHWVGSGLFLQNSFIFIASLLYKFGRVENGNQW